MDHGGAPPAPAFDPIHFRFPSDSLPPPSGETVNQVASLGHEAAFAHIPLVGVWRNGFLESVHHGTAVLTGTDGSVIEGHGAVDAAMFPRSANKPFQGLAMVRSGL